jgi:hypothetical protein
VIIHNKQVVKRGISPELKWRIELKHVCIRSRYKRIGGLNFTVLVEPRKENTTALLYRYKHHNFSL